MCSFLWLSNIPLYMYHNFFIHSPVDGCLGCFHALAISSLLIFNYSFKATRDDGSWLILLSPWVMVALGTIPACSSSVLSEFCSSLLSSFSGHNCVLILMNWFALKEETDRRGSILKAGLHLGPDCGLWALCPLSMEKTYQLENQVPWMDEPQGSYLDSLLPKRIP